MGRAPCCDKTNVKKGPWSPEEDAKLKEYIEKHGTGGNWISLPQKAGLKRCGKSCRLRWLNYLRPNIKHGEFSDEEDRIICSLFANIGSRWSIIAAQLPGRTDNDIKNYWNTKLKKKLMGMVNLNNYPSPRNPLQSSFSSLLQKSLSLPSPQISSSYNTTYYTPAATARSFSTLNSSFSNSLLSSINLQPPQMKHDDNVLIFGGGTTATTTEASCSSSDGSCNNNNNNKHQIINNKELEMQQNCFYNNGWYHEEHEQKPTTTGFSWSTTTTDQSTSIDYGLEEIKQLISSSNQNNNMGLFDDDENKTEEKVMLYY